MSKKSFAVQGNAEGLATALEVNDQLVSVAESFARIPERIVIAKKQLAGAANPFTLAHSLGFIPDSFSYSAYSDARIYSQDSDRPLWTDKVIVLRSSTASAMFDLILYKF